MDIATHLTVQYHQYYWNFAPENNPVILYSAITQFLKSGHRENEKRPAYKPHEAILLGT